MHVFSFSANFEEFASVGFITRFRGPQKGFIQDGFIQPEVQSTFFFFFFILRMRAARLRGKRKIPEGR